MTYKKPILKKEFNYRQMAEFRFIRQMAKLRAMHLAEMRNIIDTYPPCSIKEDDSTYGDRIMHYETH